MRLVLTGNNVKPQTCVGKQTTHKPVQMRVEVSRNKEFSYKRLAKSDAIENESLRMLMENMRVQSNRGRNTRHAQFLFVLLGTLVVALGLYMAATWLFAH